jgi:hypothetical protein
MSLILAKPSRPAARLRIRTVSVNTTVSSDDDVLLVGEPVDITLPVAANSTGRTIDIKNISTGIVRVLPQAGDNIDGFGGYSIEQTNTNIKLISDGNDWYIL